MDFKKRVQAAIDKFSEKQLPKKPRKKRNENVEGPVVLAIKNHLNGLGWDMKVIEAKAVFNEKAGRYISSQADPGTSDLCGNDPNGHAAFIEVKALGKLKTLRLEQRDFLISKIDRNCFACVADSVERVMHIYAEWCITEFKKAYLLKQLPEMTPKQKAMVDADLDFDDLEES